MAYISYRHQRQGGRKTAHKKIEHRLNKRRIHMLKLLHKMRRREWGMAAVCTLLILGQIYFDLALPDYGAG